MKIRIHAFVGTLLALLLATGPLSARERLVVFGDSLSDPGNYYAVYHQVSRRPFAPVPDAPYALGGMHYSNGATWVEQLSRQLRSRDSSGPALAARDEASNYAIGRARARTGAAAFPYYDLSTQVSLYLGRSGNHATSGTLYVVWIGANDLKDALESLATDPSFATAAGIMQQAIGSTAANVQSLWAAGARRFLIVGMPNLAIAPAIAGLGPQAQYAAGLLSSLYNDGLAQAETALSVLPGVRITRLDVNAVFEALAMTPGLAGINDIDTPCLRFGVIEHAVCAHPDQYLFWDGIHPTAAGHGLIAAAALNALTAP